ncbi:Glutathione S-transferase lancl1, variant 2 [Chamberlinius hualienensis]
MDVDVRYFENTYADYGPGVDFVEYNEDTNEIHPKWKEKLEKYIHHQLQVIGRYGERDSRNDFSVYTGLSGIGLLYLFISERLGDKYTDYLKKAKALNVICVDSLRGHHRLSFICGYAGVLAIGSVIYHKEGLHKKRDELLEKLVRLHEHVIDGDCEDEILYGRAGYLYSLLYVRLYIKEDNLHVQSTIKLVIQAIINSGKKLSKKEKWKCPLMYSWHDKHYMGAAHGISGILYMLLQVSDILTEDEKRNLIKPTVDYLISLKFPSGNYPSSYGNGSDKLVHWCHGAPGFIHLFVIAYKVIFF